MHFITNSSLLNIQYQLWLQMHQDHLPRWGTGLPDESAKAAKKMACAEKVQAIVVKEKPYQKQEQPHLGLFSEEWEGCLTSPSFYPPSRSTMVHAELCKADSRQTKVQPGCAFQRLPVRLAKCGPDQTRRAQLGPQNRHFQCRYKQIQGHFYKANFPKKRGLWPLIWFECVFCKTAKLKCQI